MVLSIAVTLILQLFSGGMRAKSKAEAYTRAVFHAQEVMESLLLSPAILEAPMEGGFDDGYSWSALLEEELEPGAAAGEDAGQRQTGPRLFRLTVDVIWRQGESTPRYRLTTLTIADVKQTETEEEP